MSHNRPQFYPNILSLAPTDESSLERTLEELQKAVRHGVGLIEVGDPASDEYDGRGIFQGSLGIATAYLRLAHQSPSLAKNSDTDTALPAFHTLARQRIPAAGPDLPLRLGGLSPLASKSPLAAVVLRVLEKASPEGSARPSISTEDLAVLREAVDLALSHGAVAFYNGHNLGADEVLFGRSGLLWALLNIRTHLSVYPVEIQQQLEPVLEGIPKLVEAIILAGRQGASDYRKAHGEKDAFPLMWTWMERHYGLGLMHGMSGIISVLLACRPEDLQTSNHNNPLPDLAATITALCRVCIAHNGHLPTTIPPRSSSRSAPLVQICHGSPGLLTLLGCARKNTPFLLNYWEPEWDEATFLATECVWREGLLSKGGCLCHGMTGNAWPWLLLHDSFEYAADVAATAKAHYAERFPDAGSRSSPTIERALTGDYFLSRAIAMMLHARETHPFHPSLETASHDYRMPDRPWCFFEGLAGMVCAWAETCAVIQGRLRKMQLEEDGVPKFQDDQGFRDCIQQQLGFPFAGGDGPSGWL